MSTVAIVLQVLAVILLFLAAFAVKVPHLDGVGWLGLAFFVLGVVLPNLKL
jgi:hypothetical protein